MKLLGLFTLVLSIAFSSNSYSQFVQITTGIPNLGDTDASWGDYDSDGDLDLLIAGFTAPQAAYSAIFRNDAGVFTNINANLVQAGGPVEWGDYDGDGDLDCFVAGYQSSVVEASARVYRNDNGVFSIVQTLDPILAGDAEWGDYDNDGDLDLIYSGNYSTSTTADRTRLYKNDSGTLVPSGITFPGFTYGSISLGDYDNDGDLDILFTGESGSFPNIPTRIYKNTNGTFSAVNLPIPKYLYSAAAWCDYDNDGDLDFAISGAITQPFFDYNTSIYRNDNGTFVDIGAGFEGTHKSNVTWGDFDNDGDADLLYSGEGSFKMIRLCRNDNGAFIVVTNPFSAFEFGVLNWLDYDNNGTLDLFQSGGDSGPYITRLYKNEIATTNTPPSPPSNPNVDFNTNSMTFYWQEAVDNQTPAPGLSYNIQLGSSSGTGNIMPGNSLNNGYRKIIGIGNTQKLNSWTIYDLPSNYIYFRVQAIDPSFAGSEWTTVLLTPVELISFICETDHNEVLLHWTTATELNNNGFEVQRCSNDEKFITIGFTKGNGTTSNTNSYSFIDKNVSEGSYQYRLKQVDFNGSFQYSEIIQIDVLAINDFNLLQNFPNPFNPITKIKYQLPEDSKVQLTVIDVLGNKVAELINEYKSAGNHEVVFDASGFVSGIYFYRIQAEKFVDTKKMVLMK